MPKLNCRLATEADLAALCQFYQDICAHQKDDQFGADWHWGIYPSEKDIAEAIA
ncbi:MAG: Putative acetyltransferase [Lactobacillus delbrueckii]|jgi:N-alpha-acetyltransferase 60